MTIGLTSVMTPELSTEIAKCVLALAGWFTLRWISGCRGQEADHIEKSRFRITARWLLIPRWIVFWVFWYQVMTMIANSVETSREWPVWLLAASVSIVSELILSTPDSAMSTANSSFHRVVTFCLPFLRMSLAGLLAMMLLEPAISRVEERTEVRTVAVLIDSSASMELPVRRPADPGETRAATAMRLLNGKGAADPASLPALQQKYRLNVYRFGATAQEWSSPENPGDQNDLTAIALRPSEKNSPESTTASDDGLWAQSTDFAAALRHTGDAIPLRQLSGIILLTDGCDHSRTDLQDVSRRFARHGIPLNTVLIGSQKPVRDADIVELNAPPQIYEGDTLTLRATVRANSLKGEKTIVRLLENDNLVEEHSVSFTSDRYRETIAFQHTPKSAGIHRYCLELKTVANEESPANNLIEKNVRVSADRIRLLVIESRPRWEFRYLRNLFAGRDKTVFLQAVLLHPDRLAGVPDPPTVHASAARAFDDCDANALPATEAEWMKFDAIILGDVSPADLDAEATQVLETFVTKRGGCLIVIAGRNAMPHAYRDNPLSKLFPVSFSGRRSEPVAIPAEEFQLVPSDLEGPDHDSASWNPLRTSAGSYPPFSWRHPDMEAKPGATVLAYAIPRRPDNKVDETAPRIPVEEQRRNAILLWHRVGAGRVLQFNTDETWRLRYGIGDRLHHQFWGQLIRWSVTDRLPAGTDLVRMGTNRSLYQSGSPITVQARLLDAQRDPVINQPVEAVLFLENQRVRSVQLKPRNDQSGLLECEIRDVRDPGRYRIELQGEAVRQCLAAEGRSDETVSLDVAVAAPLDHPESMDLVADPKIPQQLAASTGGIVVTPDTIQDAINRLGPESTSVRIRWTLPLWNLWPVIGLFLGGLSVEWTLRRLTGRI